MVEETSNSVSSGEIEITVKNPYSHIEHVKQVFEDRGEITEGRKGLYVVHDGENSWWEFSLSHSEENPSLLTLIVESNNAYLMHVIKEEVSNLLAE